eukprot:887004-Pelagomonas_calceolata.AAC.2
MICLFPGIIHTCCPGPPSTPRALKLSMHAKLSRRKSAWSSQSTPRPETRHAYHTKSYQEFQVWVAGQKKLTCFGIQFDFPVPTEPVPDGAASLATLPSLANDDFLVNLASLYRACASSLEQSDLPADEVCWCGSAPEPRLMVKHLRTWS